MFCGKCGSQVSDGQNFCSKCGAPVNSSGRMREMAGDVYDRVRNEDGRIEDSIGHEFESARRDFSGSSKPGTPLKTDRTIVAYILLSLITCGFYAYYYLYSLAKDINTACDGDGETTSGLFVFMALSFITCGIYAYYWHYKLGNRLYSNASRYGLSFQENGTTILLWDLVGIVLCGVGPFVAMHILMKNSNAICAAYNRNHGFSALY